MTYYYVLYLDDYAEFDTPRKSESLKNALKGLRRRLLESTAESGCIFNTPSIPNHLKRTPKNLVGNMYVRTSDRIIKLKLPNGRIIETYTDDCYYYSKKARKEYKVMSDGTLRAISRK